MTTERAVDDRLVEPADTLLSLCVANREKKHAVFLDAEQGSRWRRHRVVQIFAAAPECLVWHFGVAWSRRLKYKAQRRRPRRR